MVMAPQAVCMQRSALSGSAGSSPSDASQWVTSLRAATITASVSSIFLIKPERSLALPAWPERLSFYSSVLRRETDPVFVCCFRDADIKTWSDSWRAERRRRQSIFKMQDRVFVDLLQNMQKHLFRWNDSHLNQDFITFPKRADINLIDFVLLF